MVHNVLVDLPAWLLWGVALGLLGSVAAAGVFLVGVRLFPTRPPSDDSPSGDGPSGDARRRVEIREYLDTIDEAYVEERAVGGETIAFYLPERDVAITFDPRAFYRIDRSATHAVLVEHEMPGINLGYRLPFETPTVDDGPDAEDVPPAATDSDPDARAAALATLGLPAEASPEEVRAAYRQQVKEVHPDHGGDEEAFKQVREAYTTAKRHANA